MIVHEQISVSPPYRLDAPGDECTCVHEEPFMVHVDPSGHLVFGVIGGGASNAAGTAPCAFCMERMNATSGGQ